MSEAPTELPVLIGPGDGEPETLMLIGQPDASSMVSMRRWSAADWSAAPTQHEMRAAALYEWLVKAHARNRTMNQSLTLLRSWLRP